MFAAEVVQVGTETLTEFSLYDMKTNRWLSVDDDGGIRFNSAEPMSLSRFYEAPDVGSEEFAFELLDFLRDQAETGELINDRFVDVTEDDLNSVGVFSFLGQRPVVIETGLSFNHDLRSDAVSFEVKGPSALVDAYVASYAQKFPTLSHGTKFELLDGGSAEKTVRVTRRKGTDFGLQR